MNINELKIIRLNVPKGFASDYYHYLLSISWARFLLVYLVIFFLINLLFGIYYSFLPNGISGVDGGYWDYFFFSVHTFSTVGYGSMAPQTLLANWIVVGETIIGLMTIALLTGLIFAKFSLPSAKVLFTQKLIVNKRNGLPYLSLRLANARSVQMVNAQIEFMVLWPEITPEGEKLRKFIDLPITRKVAPIFSMSWTVLHPIDDKSPLFGLSKTELENKGVEFFISITGTDGIHGQTVNSSNYYKVSDIAWDSTYEDMVQVLPDGTREIDYAKFNLIKRVSTQ